MNSREFIEKYKDIPLPAGYALEPEGLFKRIGDEKTLIAESPIIVPAQSRDINGDGWQSMVVFLDMDGKERELLVSRGDLIDAQAGIIRQLECSGCCCAPGQEREIKAYLRLSRPSKRMRRVHRTGWLNSRKEMVFVMPKQIIGEEVDENDENAERLVFSPPTQHPCHGNILARNKLDSWKKHVAEKAEGNPLLVFSICYSLSGPLLRFLNVEPGGVHLYGPSSSGKSTALQMAASVWGNATSPSLSGGTSFVQQWNTTINALEALAEAHNDMVLILDELGQCISGEFVKVAYDLANGQGKTRMNSSFKNQPVITWRVPFLSSGEISIREKMENQGVAIKTGQMLRALDIPTGDGIIRNPGDMNSGDFVNDLKANCAKFYGTAGPAFVQYLVACGVLTDKDNQAEMQELHEAFFNELTPAGFMKERARVARRLAVVALAGELCIDAEILPFQKKEIIESCKYVMDLWAKDTVVITDGMRGAKAVRDYIKGHIGLFVSPDAQHLHEIAGYRYVDSAHDLDLYLFTDNVFKKACAGASILETARELKRRHVLHQNNSSKNKALLVIGGHRQSFYAIKADILSKPFSADEVAFLVPEKKKLKSRQEGIEEDERNLIRQATKTLVNHKEEDEEDELEPVAKKSQLRRKQEAEEEVEFEEEDDEEEVELEEEADKQEEAEPVATKSRLRRKQKVEEED